MEMPNCKCFQSKEVLDVLGKFLNKVMNFWLKWMTHLIVHVIPITHVVTGASAGLNVPLHVELNILATNSPRRCHHRVTHAVPTRAVHPRIALVQVTTSRVIVPDSTGTPGIRSVSHTRLRSVIVSQRSVKGRRDILQTKGDPSE